MSVIPSILDYFIDESSLYQSTGFYIGHHLPGILNDLLTPKNLSLGYPKYNNIIANICIDTMSSNLDPSILLEKINDVAKTFDNINNKVNFLNNPDETVGLLSNFDLNNNNFIDIIIQNKFHKNTINSILLSSNNDIQEKENLLRNKLNKKNYYIAEFFGKHNKEFSIKEIIKFIFEHVVTDKIKYIEIKKL